MIRRDDVIDAIAECNGVRKPNAHTCILLASYYTILDHIDQDKEKPHYSFEPAPAEESNYQSDTEFFQAVQGKDINNVLEIIDELMSTLQVVYPRLYEGVMVKIAG